MKTKKTVRFIWAFLILLNLLIILALVARLLLPRVVLHRINAALDDALAVEASAAAFSASLRDGRIGLYGIRVLQPAGFGPGHMAVIPALEVAVEMRTLFADTLIIKDVRMLDADVVLIRNASGMNTSHIVSKDVEPEKPADPRQVLIRHLQVDNLRFSYLDTLPESGHLSVRTGFVRLEVDNLNIGSAAETPASAAHCILTGRLVQAPSEDAYVGLVADVGQIQPGTVPVNAALRLIGVELNPLSVILPAGTSRIIGGDALDVLANISIGESKINGLVKIDTIGGYTHKLVISGTPDTPHFETEGIFTSLLQRAEGILGKTAGRVVNAGGSVAGTVVGGAVELGKGAKDTATSFLGGLASIAKGVVTADPGEVREGIKESTVGTVRSAAGAVVGTGRELVTGVAEAAMDPERGVKWRQSTAERWEQVWTEAVEWVEQQEFPPNQGDE